LQAGRTTIVVLVAVVLLLAIGARLIAGKVLPGNEGDPVTTVAPPAGNPALQEADLVALLALNLFSSTGTAATPQAPAAPPATQTVLNLRLEGVMLAANADASVAIIVSNARQGSYRAGASLPVGAEVQLESIHNDHVVINNRGQRETLWLYAGKDAAAPPGNRPGPLPTGGNGVAAGSTSAVSTNLRTAATNLASADPALSKAAAATLAEILTVSPAQENGRLIGYRLTPGARLKDFVQLGFMTNDVVTSVNGIPLTDMANLPQLYGLLNEATEVSFSLLRAGQPVTLHIALAAP
jgi:general secretion pathway protein C